MNWKSFLLILLIALLFACLLFFLATVQTAALTFDNLQKLWQGGFVVRADAPTVVAQVQSLSRLETVRYTLQRVIEGRVGYENPILDAFLGDRLLLVAYGEVVAGMDLGLVTQEDVVIRDNRLVLKLPAAQILTQRLDNSKTYVYDRRQGLLTRGDQMLETRVRQEAEKTIVKAACEDGIITKAEENARLNLKALLSTFGFQQIVFEKSGKGASSTGCEAK